MVGANHAVEAGDSSTGVGGGCDDVEAFSLPQHIIMKALLLKDLLKNSDLFDESNSLECDLSLVIDFSLQSAIDFMERARNLSCSSTLSSNAGSGGSSSIVAGDASATISRKTQMKYNSVPRRRMTCEGGEPQASPTGPDTPETSVDDSSGDDHQTAVSNGNAISLANNDEAMDLSRVGVSLIDMDDDDDNDTICQASQDLNILLEPIEVEEGAEFLDKMQFRAAVKQWGFSHSANFVVNSNDAKNFVMVCKHGARNRLTPGTAYAAKHDAQHTGCKSRVRCIRIGDDKWRVIEVNDNHNHTLSYTKKSFSTNITSRKRRVPFSFVEYAKKSNKSVV